MTVYVYDPQQDKVVPREEKLPPPSKSAHVISDAMPMLKHMGTGVMTDSKSHFRQMTKASGGIEVGNDPQARTEKPRDVPPMSEYVESVKRAIQEVNR